MASEIITGKAFVLGDDIDTDQIIPAEYLAYNPSDPEERKYFGMYAMVGVPETKCGLPKGGMKFVPEGEFKTEYTVVIGGKNFGCGSSREHAPLAIAEAGARVVVAEFYARIFFRNCVNGGYLLPCETTQRLIEEISTGDEVEVDIDNAKLTNKTNGKTYELKPLGDVKPIVDAGGVFDYARQTGMLGKKE
ncbi:3-isopropylmalate dehydratase [Phycisphaerales bacterium AB-hyl4]|uniref:3-isopropylmalate dehydratase n=1 Tax=Natronomicrosphaera hydrolytica TaxID=3242702 RepID=A0ABV4U6S7_9BACT